MSRTPVRIAISGKGGVGKSTVAALTVRLLSSTLGRAVLAVDADPNATLAPMLGLDPGNSVADLREETLEKKDAIPAGMSKDRFIELRIQQAIVEHTGFDLLTMGRPEGPGCYCYVNNLLRRYLERVSDDYAYVVIDNEAGMEHLSRRTNSSIDLLLVVTEPTVIGVDTVRRIAELAGTLPIAVRRTAIVLNRIPPAGVSPAVAQALAATGLDVVGEIPLDLSIMEAAASGASLLDLPDDSPVLAIVSQTLARELGLADPAAAPLRPTAT